MTEQSKKTLVRDAEGLANYFSVGVTIKIFGHTIWEFHFPPKS